MWIAALFSVYSGCLLIDIYSVVYHQPVYMMLLLQTRLSHHCQCQRLLLNTISFCNKCLLDWARIFCFIGICFLIKLGTWWSMVNNVGLGRLAMSLAFILKIMLWFNVFCLYMLQKLGSMLDLTIIVHLVESCLLFFFFFNIAS